MSPPTTAKELLRPPNWRESVRSFFTLKTLAGLFLVSFWLLGVPVAVCLLLAVPVAPAYVAIRSFGFGRGLLYLLPYVGVIVLCIVGALAFSPNS